MKHVYLVGLALALAACGGDDYSEDIEALEARVDEQDQDETYDPDDPDDVGMELSHGYYCSKLDSYYFQYTIWVYTSGDKFINCSVTGASHQSTEVALYRADQVGADTDACSLTFDIETNSGGYWEFESNGSSRTATYHDAGASVDGYVLSFASGDCISF